MTENKSPSNLIAAIDVGTNSFHMVIASVTTRGVLQIHARSKELVRLGSSAGDMKRITPSAMKRGVSTLKMFAELALQHRAQVRAVATSAVREALNADEFVQEVLQKTGVDVEVISGVEEGRLIFAGASRALPIHNVQSLVIDIGGGSTELTVGVKGSPIHIVSSKLGHIRLTRRFFPDEKITSSQVNECRQAIRNEWAPEMLAILERGFVQTVGCSGTIASLAQLVLSNTGKKIPDNLNGVVISRGDLLNAVEQIVSASTLQKRLQLPGIDAKRADVIVGGALIMEQAVLGLNIQEFTISGYALREGIVYDTIQKQRNIEEHHHLAHLRYRSVTSLCEQFRIRRSHAEHVKDLSLQLFDSLKGLHGFADQERELLEAAALLHDVGYHIASEQHHKHSEYIIRNSSMLGFTNDETNLIAAIARYHRKSHPKKKHQEFGLMTEKEQRTTQILAGILRIAEGLDRRQQSYVRSLAVTLTKASVTLELLCGAQSPDVELWSAERRKELLETSLGLGIRFSVSMQ